MSAFSMRKLFIAITWAVFASNLTTMPFSLQCFSTR
jgi:hypothetical protein